MILLEKFGALGGGGETLGGMVLMTPTSINYTGTSASIGGNGSVTFSSCSVVSLNGVFNTDYDNYVAIFRASSSTAQSWHVRLRIGGVDNSIASSYTLQKLEAEATTVAGSRSSDSYAASTLVDYTAIPQNASHLSFFGPFLAQPTAMRTTTAWSFSGGYINDRVFTHNQSTSYDGFSVLTLAGNTSGTISVYGLVGT